MTNTQNIGATIVALMVKENELKEAYNKAEEWNTACYNRVLIWEEAYIDSGKDERTGQTLDEVYDDYSEANDAMREAEERVEAIAEALQALRTAFDAVEWLGL